LDRRTLLVHDPHRPLLNVFLRDGDDAYRTSFLQRGRMVQTIGSIWSMSPLTPYGRQSDDEDAPERWAQAPFSFCTAVTTSSTLRRPRPAHNWHRSALFHVAQNATTERAQKCVGGARTERHVGVRSDYRRRPTVDPR